MYIPPPCSWRSEAPRRGVAVYQVDARASRESSIYIRGTGGRPYQFLLSRLWNFTAAGVTGCNTNSSPSTRSALRYALGMPGPTSRCACPVSYYAQLFTFASTSPSYTPLTLFAPSQLTRIADSYALHLNFLAY